MSKRDVHIILFYSITWHRHFLVQACLVEYKFESFRNDFKELHSWKLSLSYGYLPTEGNSGTVLALPITNTFRVSPQTSPSCLQILHVYHGRQKRFNYHTLLKLYHLVIYFCLLGDMISSIQESPIRRLPIPINS